jgi:hypothetical protein
MQPFDDEGDDSDIVFRDLIMLTLSGFVTVAVLLLPHIGESKARSTATETTEPPGNVILEARWPDDMDVDVDLWVQAPADVPVGYSNKGGVVFNLLRDDLGKRADATAMNYEVSYSRGMPAGEYTVNVHLYRNTARVSSIPVTIVASVKKSMQESARQILSSKVDLTREGQEQTVFRFRLNDRGELVPGTVTNLQRPIRNWKPT